MDVTCRKGSESFSSLTSTTASWAQHEVRLRMPQASVLSVAFYAALWRFRGLKQVIGAWEYSYERGILALAMSAVAWLRAYSEGPTGPINVTRDELLA